MACPVKCSLTTQVAGPHWQWTRFVPIDATDVTGAQVHAGGCCWATAFPPLLASNANVPSITTAIVPARVAEIREILICSSFPVEVPRLIRPQGPQGRSTSAARNTMTRPGAARMKRADHHEWPPARLHDCRRPRLPLSCLECRPRWSRRVPAPRHAGLQRPGSWTAMRLLTLAPMPGGRAR